MILSFYLRWTEFTKYCEFAPMNLLQYSNFNLVSSISYVLPKKAFQKLWKIVFIFSNKHFSFLRYSMFFFSSSFSFQFPDSKGSIFVNMFCNSKRRVTSSRPFFVFHNLAHKKGLGTKEKIKLPFSRSHLK